MPVEITVFEDRSFTYVLKTAPAAVLIRLAAGIPKGSKNPRKEKVGKITKDQLRQIAETKMPDLNALRHRRRHEHHGRYRAQHGRHHSRLRHVASATSNQQPAETGVTGGRTGRSV